MRIAGRAVAFGIVGALGLVVQLATFGLVTRMTEWPLWLCTAVAVEVAIVHNTLWHRRWTWRHRRAGPWWRPFARFHVTNGALSLVATPLLVWWLSTVGQRAVVAHLVAVAVVGVANFLAADSWAFSDDGALDLGVVSSS